MRFITQKGIIKSDFIFQSDDVVFPSCHASTISETDNGLIAAWFGGTHERNPDVAIYISKCINDVWSKPVQAADGIHNNYRYPCWNPVLYNDGTQILLFYKVGPSPASWWGMLTNSNDNGETWSKPCQLPDGIFGPIRNKPVKMSNGELLCPSSTENEGWQVHMEITPDAGLSWERTSSLNDGKKIRAIQPTILTHPNDLLQIIVRCDNDFLMTSWSKDFGRTWSTFEPINLPSANSGIDGVTLKDGSHLLVYNHQNRTKNWWEGRHTLELAISEDGRYWKTIIQLENDPEKKAEFSYPAIIQTNDGLIHIIYSWKRKLIKHIIVDPEKL